MKSTYLRLALIVALAIGLRVLMAQLIGDSRVPWNYEYEEIANNLVARGEYAYSFYNLTPPRPTSFLPPVYPLFLAFTQRWGKAGDSIVKTLQVAFSCLTLLSLYALTRELGGSEGQGTLAALFMAIYPPLAAYAVSSSPVTLETLFVIAGVWLVVRAVNNASLLSAVGAGVTLSLAALTRSTWIVLLPLAVVWIVGYRKGSLSARGRQVVLMLVAAAIILAPWVGYNYATHGEWVLTSTNGGLNFWIGNNPQATGEYIFPTKLNKEMVVSVANWPEVARDRFFYARGFEFIQDSPVEFLKLCGHKLLYFLFFRPNVGSSYKQAQLPLELARWLFVLSWLALIPFALVGLFNVGQRWREHAWLIIIFVSQAMISALYFAGTRFRTPIDGFAMIWTAIGMSVLVNKWQRQR